MAATVTTTATQVGRPYVLRWMQIGPAAIRGQPAEEPRLSLGPWTFSFVHRDVADAAAAHLADESMFYSDAVGPTLTSIVRGVAVQVLYGLVGLLVGFFTSECHGSTAQYNGQAALCVIAPFWAVKLWLEVITLRYVTVPYLQQVGCWYISKCPVPFWIWLLYGIGNTVIQDLSMCTASLLVGARVAYYKQLACGDVSRAFEIWDKVVEQSTPLQLFRQHIFEPRLWRFYVLAGTGVLVAPLFLVLLVCPGRQGWSGLDLRVTRERLQRKYRSISGHLISIGVAFANLTDALQMGTHTQLNIAYPLHRAEHGIAGFVAVPFDLQRATDPARLYRDAYLRTLSRVGIFGTLAQGPLLQLQLTSFAMNACLRQQETTDWQLCLSMFFAVLSNLSTFSSIIEIFRLRRQVLAHCERLRGLQFQSDALTLDDARELAERHAQVRRSLVWLCLATAIFTLNFVIAIAKFVGLHRCQDKFWNFQSFFSFDEGCVALPGLCYGQSL